MRRVIWAGFFALSDHIFLSRGISAESQNSDFRHGVIMPRGAKPFERNSASRGESDFESF
jgi:hypothetical protein